MPTGVPMAPVVGTGMSPHMHPTLRSVRCLLLPALQLTAAAAAAVLVGLFFGV